MALIITVVLWCIQHSGWHSVEPTAGPIPNRAEEKNHILLAPFRFFEICYWLGLEWAAEVKTAAATVASAGDAVICLPFAKNEINKMSNRAKRTTEKEKLSCC